jgi:hypothetical protein
VNIDDFVAAVEKPVCRADAKVVRGNRFIAHRPAMRLMCTLLSCNRCMQ